MSDGMRLYPGTGAARSRGTVKACGCFVGFCRAETLLDALTAKIMAHDTEASIASLQAAYDEQAAKCCGGFRAVPPREDR